jgi:hypothetical protein
MNFDLLAPAMTATFQPVNAADTPPSMNLQRLAAKASAMSTNGKNKL